MSDKILQGFFNRFSRPLAPAKCLFPVRVPQHRTKEVKKARTRLNSVSCRALCSFSLSPAAFNRAMQRTRKRAEESLERAYTRVKVP